MGLVRKFAEEEDPRAFREFFDLYYERLLRLAHYYVESGFAAEEVVSTVFIGIWNNRKKLKDIVQIEAYLFTSVKYKSLSYLRDNEKNSMLSVDAEEPMMKSVLKDPLGDLLNNELREQILNIVNGLPPRCKVVFELVKDDGLKYKEVAEILDISVKAVEAQVSKAMITIRKKIYPYLGDEDFKRYESRPGRGFKALFFFFF